MFPDIVIKLQDLKIDDIQGSQEIESPREGKIFFLVNESQSQRLVKLLFCYPNFSLKFS